MKIAVFCDKFSGTLSAREVINSIKSNFNSSNINADFYSVTDGGQDSTNIFLDYGFEIHENFKITNFENKLKSVKTLLINHEIYFESAQLIGIDALSNTHSLSSGCLDQVVKKINILGIGGSKTIDFGIGLLKNLGMQFISNGETIKNPTPETFKFITDINLKNFNHNLEIKVLTDTNISLLGENSAFDVFGPQKGMNLSAIATHKNNVENLVTLIGNKFKLNLDPYKEQSGAGGGLTFTLNQVLGCEIMNGAKYFLNQTNLKEKINNYEVAIFCEGKFDSSSLNGKIIGELLKIFKGSSYFLGGQYASKEQNYFKNYFECGTEGLINPIKSLNFATKELIKELNLN